MRREFAPRRDTLPEPVVYPRIMDRSAELRIPIVTVTIRIAIAGKPVADAELFVPDEPRSDRGQLFDDVAAMLDGTAEFIPVREPASPRVRLIAKHAISWIAIPLRDPDAPSATDSELVTLYDRRHRVEIEVALAASGSGPDAPRRLTGVLLDSSPADRSRALDHLNRAIRFVRLWTTENHVLINKSQILEVLELTELPEAE